MLNHLGRRGFIYVRTHGEEVSSFSSSSFARVRPSSFLLFPRDQTIRIHSEGPLQTSYPPTENRRVVRNCSRVEGWSETREERYFFSLSALGVLSAQVRSPFIGFFPMQRKKKMSSSRELKRPERVASSSSLSPSLLSLSRGDGREV